LTVTKKDQPSDKCRFRLSNRVANVAI